MLALDPLQQLGALRASLRQLAHEPGQRQALLVEGVTLQTGQQFERRVASG